MIRNPLLEKIKLARAKYVDIYVDNSFDLSARIQFLMNKKGIDQKKLAQLLNKNESEISKWMSGSHNFTLKTLAKIEDVLGNKLFEVCQNDTYDEIHDEFTMTYLTSTFKYELKNQCEIKSNTEGLKKYSSKKPVQVQIHPLEAVVIN